MFLKLLGENDEANDNQASQTEDTAVAALNEEKNMKTKEKGEFSYKELISLKFLQQSIRISTIGGPTGGTEDSSPNHVFRKLFHIKWKWKNDIMA